MFVVLEHIVRDGDVHWDFLVEVPDRQRLATWRLAARPWEADPVRAVRIADHRRDFLDYEGPLTRDRGRVRREDRGEADVRRWADPELLVALAGERLRGLFEITQEQGGLVFRRVAGDESSGGG